MIDKNKIKLCAQNIVTALNFKKEGECVFIKGGTYSQELLEEIALETYRKGGLPLLSSASDYYIKSYYTDEMISNETLEKTHTHYLKMIENIDAYVIIEPLENPGIMNDVNRDRLKSYAKSLAPIRDVLYGANEKFAPGKKWIYAAWPSKKAADFYNIDYQLLEQFCVDGMAVPMEDLEEITKNLGSYFEDAKKIYITDDSGSDFWVSVENRNKILDNGLISDEQIKSGDLGGNLPAGEIFFPPNENMGEGTVYCPLTKDRYSKKIIRGLNLVFKNGKLQMDKITADNDLETVIESFKQCEEIDRNNNLPEIRTYNVAELGIGCNPRITKAIGYILTDEKINGSVHVAFGMNNLFGGTSKSQMHWDFVTSPNVNLTVEYKNGSKRIIMEDGKLMNNL